MVAENFKPRTVSITQDERAWLMKKQIPPENWFVWIGFYKGGDWANLSIFQTRARLSPTPVPGPSETPHYIQATTFGIGHILFSVVSSSLPGVGTSFAGREPFGLVQIWPPQARSILWPTATILGDSDAYNVANIIRLSNAFNHSLDPGANWAFTGF